MMLVPRMWLRTLLWTSLRITGCLIALSWVAPATPCAQTSDNFDVLSGVLESPQFKRLSYLKKLYLAADLLKENKLKQADLEFTVLDWADRYLREPQDPLDRLKRWAHLTSDENLKSIRLPRDFLNRMLVAEYLMDETGYVEAKPDEKLKILAGLEKDQLLDWAVFLSYARVYAGAIIMDAAKFNSTSPLQALRTLKRLKEKGLIGWHYKVPTEGVLVAEALAQDEDYQKARPVARLAKLRDLQKRGLISPLTRKELERLPAWRYLISDPAFRKAEPLSRKQHLLELREKGLISESTCADLVEVFGPPQLTPPVEPKPAPVPRDIRPSVQ